MVVLMHYAATSVLEAHGPREVREAIARGEHLSSLAFSEAGSRSHFWAPMSTATGDGTAVRLDARKSWVTSAGEADSYVWSSKPLAAAGPMTLWLVPSAADGLLVAGQFDGVGLRGNASKPVTAEGVKVARAAMLGADGAGLDIALGTALPAFLTGNAAFSVGLTTALLDEAATHLTTTRLEHLGQTLAQQPVTRTEFARLRTRGDEARAFLADTLAALGAGRADATLRVLQVKAVASEAASEVADGVMRLCGGRRVPQGTRRRAPLPRHPGRPRDGADHAGAARLRRPRHAGPAAVRRGAVDERPDAADGRGRLRPQGGHHLGGLPALAARLRAALRLPALLQLRAAGRGSRRGADPRGVELAAGLGARPAPRRRRGPDGAGRRHARHRPRPHVGGRRALPSSTRRRRPTCAGARSPSGRSTRRRPR